VKNFDQLKAKGVDTVVCTAVNDPWVMQAWAESQGVDGRIVMLADGNADFARVMGLETDLGVAGLGVRSQRYAAIIEDGTITSLDVEPNPGVDVSSCESMLAKL
ncbi:MAG TPA: redoxin family protein, partial [Acidimicrobiales bacterium]|nr:redoxin family protein [Acidimicrobiales bacterium]